MFQSPDQQTIQSPTNSILTISKNTIDYTPAELIARRR